MAANRPARHEQESHIRFQILKRLYGNSGSFRALKSCPVYWPANSLKQIAEFVEIWTCQNTIAVFGPLCCCTSIMDRPKPWREFKPKRFKWLMTPLRLLYLSLVWAIYIIDWSFGPVSNFFRKLEFIKFLDYAAKFTIVVGIWYYIFGANERKIEKQVQAWQMVSLAQQADTGPGLARALELANQSKLNLSDMVLTNKSLTRINLSKGNLQNTYFRESKLMSANFYKANLKGADLRGSNLKFANLSKANLEEADLRGADLGDAKFFKGNLDGVKISGADLSNTDLHGRKFAKMDLFKTSFRHANLSKADFSDVHSTSGETDFAIDFTYTDLNETIFKNARVGKTDFWGAEGIRIDFRNANLSGSRMRAYLREADFRGANLTGVSFFEADLHQADFTGADITDASFVEAFLGGADLSEVLNAKQEQFEEAYWDDNTKWPPGIRPPTDPKFKINSN